jgi:hypothetical protein
MEAKVIALLVKQGHNPERAAQFVSENLQWAMQAYPNARPHFYADVCSSV